MNGKEYLESVIEKAQGVLSGIKASEKLDGDPLLEGLAKSCETLGQLKNKATLRTRSGATLAIPVFESVERLEEEWENAGGGDDLGDVKERIEEFLTSVDVLGGALKERTVIMT